MLPTFAVIYVAMSILAIALFGFDKRAAARGKWRIPEATLHAVELLGGWPGALLAMRLFRHKSAKSRYRIITAGIVLLHSAAWAAGILLLP